MTEPTAEVIARVRGRCPQNEAHGPACICDWCVNGRAKDAITLALRVESLTSDCTSLGEENASLRQALQEALGARDEDVHTLLDSVSVLPWCPRCGARWLKEGINCAPDCAIGLIIARHPEPTEEA